MPEPGPQTRIKDDRIWAVGADEDVAWINDGVSPGLSITASIPPIFAAYATLVFPLGLESSRDQMRPAEAPVAEMVEDLAVVHRYNQRGSGRSRSDGPFDVASFVADLEGLRQHRGHDR